MGLTIGIPRETWPGETRVALLPDLVQKLVQQGFTVHVEAGAGAQAFASDAAYREAGAEVVTSAWGADVVVAINLPDVQTRAALKPGSVLVGMLRPLDERALMAELAAQGVTLVSMELVPRISRAQRMDALSAMSNLAGYRAVLNAAALLPRFFPLLTTAAGTVKPASVLVLGVGVAGLQAIATARRLGAKVSAYDVRPSSAEEVKSLGATFVDLKLDVGNAQDAGGYAKALAEEQARRQVEALIPHIAQSDVVISTALIPGRKAPLLVAEEAVRKMAPGSVIVDLAAPNGGNCALTRPGETFATEEGVTVSGPLNLPAEMPAHASMLYGRTLMALLGEILKPDGLRLNREDEVVKGALVAIDGALVHPRLLS